MQLVQVKYRSPRISHLPDAEILTRAAQALQRIHVITGWDLPGDSDYVKVLVEEFVTKLRDDFADMNFDEVLYAFRKYGIGIKDWGKKMNLDLICGVLVEYLTDRVKASELEEKAAVEPTQRIYTADELLNIQRMDIEHFYQRCRRGIMPVAEIPDYFLLVLKQDGLLADEATNEDVPHLFVHYLGKGYECIYRKEEENE